MSEDLVHRLKKRAEIRRQITDRKSVQEGKPDRIADLLEEAARALETRAWVDLTPEEAKQVFNSNRCDISADLAGILAKAIKAKLKEKNI